MKEAICKNNKEPLKVQFITDTHYYSRTSGTSGKAYENAESMSQVVIKDSDLVLKAGFELLLKDKTTDIVLLSGDTTSNGEIEAHKEFIKMLYDLKAAGKRVYVITATHDFRENGFTKGYDGDKITQVPTVKDRQELWDLYYDFGPSEAISHHRESMSYVVQLADGYRLFALNDDSNFKPEKERGSGFSDSCMQWILEQLDDARKNDQFVIAMTHHPMISPSPFYTIIGKSNIQRDSDKTREIFADAGLSCMLTGHTHVHNISFVTTEKGNRFYDISCGAFIGCPPVMRTVTFDPKNARIDVKSSYIESVDGLDTKGKSFPEYMNGFFFGTVKEVIWAAGNDIDRLAEMAPSFSVKSETVKKNSFLIKPVGKFLEKLTFKKIWRLCKKESGLKLSDIEDIKDNKVTDFILELVQNLYAGDPPYTPDTREYRLTCGFLNVIDSFLDTIHFKIGKILKGADSVRSLVEPLLWKDGYCDREAVLELYPLNQGGKRENQASFDKKYEDKVRKSKKGPLVLSILIISAILLIGIVLGLAALVVWGIIALIGLI